MRLGPLATLAIAVVAAVLPAGASAERVRSGPLTVDASSRGPLIERFAPADRYAHWLLAIVWVTLAITGLILSLARQEDPDTSTYSDPEIALRLKRRHHAGLVLRSSDPARIQALLENYSRRFAEEFLAIEPPGTKPAA